MATIQKDRILSSAARTSYDRDGDKIGSIEEIYLDAETERARVGARPHRPVRHQAHVRPAHGGHGARRGPDGAVEKDTVKDAPAVEPNGQLSQREESELYRHYGIDGLRSRPGRRAADARPP